MVRKRVEFGEFDVPIPKGHERITDKDATTEYLFIHAPREIYTICFDSSMPFYDNRVLNGYEQILFRTSDQGNRKIARL